MIYDNIPEELKILPRWVGWKTETRTGKPTKVLKNAKSGTNAMSNNPSTWSSFDAALGGMDKFKFDGIGFVFSGDGLIGIDIDDCRDESTGALSAIATDIINKMNSYTEVSPSGNGLHIIVRGELLGDKKQTFYEPGKHIGIYDDGRFFCMTGQLLDDGHADIEENTEGLTAVYEKYINVQKPSKKTDDSNNNAPISNGYVNDDEVLLRIEKSTKSAAVFALMDGNWQGGKYSSQSEADIALMNHLAYYADRNENLVWAMFTRSGMYRPEEYKRNPKKFRTTLLKAIRDCQECYSERASRMQDEKDRKHKKAAVKQEPADKTQPQPAAKPKAMSDDITSDVGRSNRFSERYEGKLYWCQEIKAWLVWNGKFWEADRILSVTQMAKAVIEEIIAEVTEMQRNAETQDQQTALSKRYKDAVKGRSEKSIKSMLELAKSDMPITTDALDVDPFLLNCQNGIVDLRTGQLFPHESRYNMSNIASANYVPGKQFLMFDQFLKRITCEDADLAMYLRDVCGMAAIGKVFFEGMCMFHGNGQNGKSTFLNTVSRVFGDYAYSINPEMLMVQKDGKQPLGIVQICGKRFVTAMETEEGRRLSGAMLKKLASTDPITGRDLYQKDRTFLPSHTLITATNFLPKVSSTDVGTWRRILVVPFHASIKAENQIKDYANQLVEKDGDAILSWIVDGAMQYIKNKYQIKIPDAVSNTTKVYRESEDWIGNFIYECCEIGDFEEQGGKLYDAYVEWCEKNNETYKRRPRDFAGALEMAGHDKRKTMHGAVWSGLRLIEAREQYSNRYKTVTPYRQSRMTDDDIGPLARREM